MQKVRAICDWICEHIQYDTDKQLVWVETDDGFDVGPIPANRYWFVQWRFFCFRTTTFMVYVQQRNRLKSIISYRFSGFYLRMCEKMTIFAR